MTPPSPAPPPCAPPGIEPAPGGAPDGMAGDLAGAAEVVLVVDDVPENLALLNDALDDAGYTVLVATSGEAALALAERTRPDVILLDAVMPGLDGFEVARRLKHSARTAAIPIVFMTGLTDTEHVVAAFAAGGTDYVTKPIRPREVLARIAAHLHSARVQRQARHALDAFGHATLVVRERDGRRVWQTALARQLLADHFGGDETTTPPEVIAFVARESLRRRVGAEPATLTVARGSRRITFALHAMPEDSQDDGGSREWLVVMRESDDAAIVEAITLALDLTAREAEVLYWVVKGKTNRDIGDILGTSPRTITKHLEHVFAKLGVETRTAAAGLAMQKVAALASQRGAAGGPAAP